MIRVEFAPMVHEAKDAVNVNGNAIVVTNDGTLTIYDGARCVAAYRMWIAAYEVKDDPISQTG